MRCPDCSTVTFRYRREGTWLDVECALCGERLGGIDVVRANEGEVADEVA